MISCASSNYAYATRATVAWISIKNPLTISGHFYDGVYC